MRTSFARRMFLSVMLAAGCNQVPHKTADETAQRPPETTSPTSFASSRRPGQELTFPLRERPVCSIRLDPEPSGREVVERPGRDSFVLRDVPVPPPLLRRDLLSEASRIPPPGRSLDEPLPRMPLP